MSKNNVRVTVSLLDNFSSTLEKLDKQLDNISKKVLTPHLDVTGEKQVDQLKLKLESLDKIIDILTRVHGDADIAASKAKIESLSGTQHVFIKTHDQQLAETIAKFEFLKKKNQISEKVRSQQELRELKRRRQAQANPLQRPSIASGEWQRNQKPNVGNVVGGLFAGLLGGGIAGSASVGGSDNDTEPPKIARGIGKNALRYLIPRGQLSQDLFAFIMPFIAQAYTAMAGMAATMGASAAAGLSIGFLGILGFGENAADSLHLAQVRLRLFGRELFKVFKPVTKTFAPIMDSFFRRAPHALGQLTGALKSLTAFIPALRRQGQGIINWVDALIQKAVELQPEISHVTSRFGELLGTNLLNFFEWITMELHDNQEAIIGVLGMFKSLLIVIYRVFQLWAFLFSVLKPVADILARIADILTNRWVAGLTATTIAFVALVTVLAKAVKLMALMKVMGLGAAIAKLVGPLFAAAGAMYAYAAAAIAASKAKALLLGIATLGAATLAIGAGIAAMRAVDAAAPDVGGSGAAGFGSGSGGVGGGGDTYHITVNGAYDRDTQNRLKDDFPGLYSTERGIEDNTAL